MQPWAEGHQGRDECGSKCEERGSGSIMESMELTVCDPIRNVCGQVHTVGEMARPTHGRGRGRRGRELPRAADLGTSDPKGGRKPVKRLINEATTTYRVGMDAGM